MIRTALEYASRGWPVFPVHIPYTKGVPCSCGKKTCDSPGKHPIAKLVPHGLKDATTDPAIIKRWWKQYPEANIGVRTGEIAPGKFLGVVDVDAHKNGHDTLASIQETHSPLPDTPHVLTGGGGDHYYFESDVPIKTTSGILGPGIDTRGGGGEYGAGYVVGADSLHSSGRHYRWELSSPETCATMPEWFVALVNGPAKTSNTQTAPVAAGEPIIDGQQGGPGRKATLVKRGRSMRAFGDDEATIYTALAAINADRCQPPLPDNEVRRMAKFVCDVPAGPTNKNHKATDPPALPAEDNVPLPEDPGVNLDTCEVPPDPAEPGSDNDVFLRGDHTEIATKMARDLGEHTVFDRSEVHLYNQKTGVWEVLSDAELACSVMRFAGAKVRRGKKTMPLCINSSDVRGVIKNLCALLSKPGFFNDAPRGIAFTNGFVTVKKAEIKIVPLDPDQRSLHALAFDYDPNAKCERFVQFLREIWVLPGEEDLGAGELENREEDRLLRVQYLLEWIGMALLGLSTYHGKCLVLLGDGSNGKSVLLKVVRAMFPKSAVQSIAPHLFSNVFHAAELSGSLINIVSELPDADIVSGEIFKAIVTGDTVNASKKFKDPFSLTSKAGHLFACNELPGTKDQSTGFWRRWATLPFDRKFLESEQDHGLTAKLIRELQGIVALCIAAIVTWQKRGRFEEPPTCTEAKRVWKRETDSVQQFAEDVVPKMFEELPPGAPGIPALALYKRFVEWSKENGHTIPLTSTKFGKRISKLCQRAHTRTGEIYVRPEPKAT